MFANILSTNPLQIFTSFSLLFINPYVIIVIKKKEAPNQSGTYQSSHSYCKGPECCPSPHGAREKALPPIGRAQSDFSFSFMCKKTMLNMKRPTIMEKAPA